MKNAILRLSALLLAVCLIAGIPLAYAADGFNYAYTYTYDYWGDLRQSPDAYRAKAFLTSTDLGLEKAMVNPQGLFVQGNDLYVVDTGNNRILQLAAEGESLTLTRIIDSFTGDIEPLTFSGPQDVYVTEEGTLFIADTNNNRILKLDKDLNLLQTFTKPTDATFDQSLSYLPTKLVTDVSGRVFALAQNVNKGLIKYEADGTFTGFIGASPVKYTWYELIWRMLSTKEQRAMQESFVPTEYDNIAIDAKGFFYVVTQTFDENELNSGAAEPVRRLNSLGTNILIENGNWFVTGDVQWATSDMNISRTGPSRFVDITVLDNDIYVALDETHNRLFGYDSQGNMLWAFGGVGNAVGYFNKPVAIDHMGYDLLVLDSQAAALTIMTPTSYGQQIYTASEQYDVGEYEASAETWMNVLKQNGNYDLAYIGVGRAKLQNHEYEDACYYFEMARDKKNYSEAFRYYRSELVEDYIGWIFAVLAVVMVVPMIISRLKKVAWDVNHPDMALIGVNAEMAGDVKVRKPLLAHRLPKKLVSLGRSLKYAFYCIFHPFDGFWDLTHEKRGSLGAANIIALAVLVTNLLSLEHTAFLFNNTYWPRVNIIQQCLAVLLPLSIFVVSNWGLTTLFEGKGKLKDVYIATCYALTPYVLLQLPMIVLSNWITIDEGAFYGVLATLSVAWSGGLIVCGMMQIHDYGLGKTLLFLVMTVAAMLIVIFLLLLFFTLVGDGVGYFTSIYKEITFRLY